MINAAPSYDLVVFGEPDQTLIRRLLSGAADLKAAEQMPSSVLVAHQPHWPLHHVAETSQGGALGSAMHGAVAAGPEAGGYASIVEATKHMARLREEAYQPIPENRQIYDRLFAEYVTLHDYFGRDANDVMKRLKQLRAEALANG